MFEALERPGFQCGCLPAYSSASGEEEADNEVQVHAGPVPVMSAAVVYPRARTYSLLALVLCSHWFVSLAVRS